MRNFFLVVSFSFFFSCSFCQDTGWRKVRIDSFLTVSLPGSVVKKDTTLAAKNTLYKTKIFRAETEFAILLITVMETDLNVNPYQPESMQKSYEGVKQGFRKNIEDKGFSLEMKDTVVNSIQGFKANVFTDDHRITMNRMSYNFCVNSLTYLVIAVPLENKVAESTEKMKQLVNSIRFDKEEILAHASNNDTVDPSLAMGEKIGELISPVLLIGGILYFFVYKSRKKPVPPYKQS
jgi:hypothetical protein